jgi:tetratricopeptide (TPR) repeat protein
VAVAADVAADPLAGVVEGLVRSLHDARALLAEGLGVAERHGAHEDAAWALHDLALAHHYLGEDERASELAARALAVARGTGYAEAISSAHYAHGLVAWRAGDHRSAGAALREALDVHRALGDRWSTARTLEALAAVAADVGAAERGALLLGAAERIRGAIGAPVSPVERDGRELILEALREQTAPRADGGFPTFPADWTRCR